MSAGIRSRFGEWVSSSGCRPQTTWGARALGSGTAQLSTRTTRIASHLQATVWGIAWGMAKGVAEAKIGFVFGHLRSRVFPVCLRFGIRESSWGMAGLEVL